MLAIQFATGALGFGLAGLWQRLHLKRLDEDIAMYRRRRIAREQRKLRAARG